MAMVSVDGVCGGKEGIIEVLHFDRKDPATKKFRDPFKTQVDRSIFYHVYFKA